MSSLDNELFELCKEVYEKIKWGKPIDFEYAVVYDDDDKLSGFITAYMGTDMDYVAPIYTSDHLLEKLPQKMSNVGTSALMLRHGAKNWYAGYSQFYAEYSDTPLKALLKLTLALHEAGKL